MGCFMKNINRKLFEANMYLKTLLEQLDILEKEKEYIIKIYNEVNESQKMFIEIEMKKNEEKFRKLYEETVKLSEKVKSLKVN